MTKFKILSWILKVFISFYILTIVSIIFATFVMQSAIEPVPRNIILSMYEPLPLFLIFAIGLYYIHQSCIMFLKRGYFNLKSVIYLKRGDYILGASALLGLCNSFIYHKPLNEKKAILDFIEKLSYNLLWLVIAFALIAIADIIKKGVNLKRENDLTI